MKKFFVSFFLVLFLLFSIPGLIILLNPDMRDRSVTEFEDNVLDIGAETPREELDIIEEDEEDEEDPPIKKVSFLAVGDVIPHLGVTYDLENGSYVHQYSEVTNIIKKADFAFANLETPIVDGKSPSGFPRFNAPITLVDSLKEVGFNILGTANNHILDQSLSGFYETLNVIRDRDLTQIGGRLSKDEKNYKILEKNGVRLGITAYTYAYNGLDANFDKDHHALSKIDIERIKRDFQGMQEESPDFCIVFLHWGNEYRTKLSEEQIKLGRDLKDMGYHLIIGSHPHVVQGVEYDNNNLTAYSLGNFISNQREIDIGKDIVENGLILACNLVVKGEEKSIEDVDFHPTWVRRKIENKKYTFKILPVEEVLENHENYDLSQGEIQRLKKSLEDTKFAIDL